MYKGPRNSPPVSGTRVNESEHLMGDQGQFRSLGFHGFHTSLLSRVLESLDTVRAQAIPAYWLLLVRIGKLLLQLAQLRQIGEAPGIAYPRSDKRILS
jgi:hypothetical protein